MEKNNFKNKIIAPKINNYIKDFNQIMIKSEFKAAFSLSNIINPEFLNSSNNNGIFIEIKSNLKIKK